MVRVKRRYIALSIKSKTKGSVAQEALIKELRNCVGQLYGDFGLACLNRGFSIKRYNEKDGSLIISVRRGVHEMVMSVAPLITKVDGNLCSINIVHLSGTIRGCLKEIKREYIMNVRATIAKNKV